MIIISQIKSFFIRVGIDKMIVRIANRENPDQTAVCLGFWSGKTVFGILEHLLLQFSTNQNEALYIS